MIEFVAFERIIFSFFILKAVVLLFKVNNSFAISLDLVVFVLDLLMQALSLLLQLLDPLLLLLNELTSLFSLGPQLPFNLFHLLGQLISLAGLGFPSGHIFLELIDLKQCHR